MNKSREENWEMIRGILDAFAEAEKLYEEAPEEVKDAWVVIELYLHKLGEE